MTYESEVDFSAIPKSTIQFMLHGLKNAVGPVQFFDSEGHELADIHHAMTVSGPVKIVCHASEESADD